MSINAQSNIKSASVFYALAMVFMIPRDTAIAELLFWEGSLRRS